MEAYYGRERTQSGQILLCPSRSFVAIKSRVKPLTSHTCKLDDAQAAALKKLLEKQEYQFRVKPVVGFVANRHDARHTAGSFANQFGKVGNFFVAENIF